MLPEPSDRAALLFSAGEDLWRAVDSLATAGLLLGRAQEGAIRLQVQKLLAQTEGLANRTETAADAAVEAE